MTTTRPAQNAASQDLRICICGCGEIIEWKPHHKYQNIKFKHKHRSRMPRAKKVSSTSRFTGYDRSKRVLKERSHCSWEIIGYCKGMIDVCHIDQNPLNNDPSNLIALCRCHHRLMDNGKIDPRNPIMPKFRTDGGGKRRYVYS